MIIALFGNIECDQELPMLTIKRRSSLLAIFGNFVSSKNWHGIMIIALFGKIECDQEFPFLATLGQARI